MAHIRTKKELYERELTPAEEQLIEACQKGEFCQLGDGDLPPEGTPDPSRHIRADVLRYLILGGCDDCKVDDIGVWVEGAHVTRTLDLDFTTARGAIRMSNSRFEERIDCEQTECRQLDLDASDLQGLSGQAMKITGNVFLRNITTHATVDLNNAIIDGPLVFSAATFVVAEGNALNAQGANITADTFLNEITTNATINLGGATIGGQLACLGATFEVDDGHSLNAQNTKINGGLIWRKATVSKGTLYFANAHTSVLADDESSWPIGGRVNLNGMTYDTIIGGPLDAKSRLAWLQKVSNWGGKFTPQPYTQLAKVLRAMGHDSDALKILEKREEGLKKHERFTWWLTENNLDKKYIRAFWLDLCAFRHWLIPDRIFKLLIGYGHAPFRSLWALALLISIAIFPAHYAWDEGSFAPNSAIIQESDGWKKHQLKSNPAKSWSDKGAAGNDWETFNRYAYGLDVVIPIINFGQTEAWAPSTNRGWWGKQLYWMRWVLGALGWIVTALGAAAITGVIRRD